MGRDVDCYDACYLPDGRIIFASTAAYEGVPCVGGGSYVANLYRMNNDGTDVRRLTFDQDASWHPSVMENGRVMFTRWEYTDSAHYFSRVLMHMNPDGTDQKAFLRQQLVLAEQHVLRPPDPGQTEHVRLARSPGITAMPRAGRSACSMSRRVATRPTARFSSSPAAARRSIRW